MLSPHLAPWPPWHQLMKKSFPIICQCAARIFMLMSVMWKNVNVLAILGVPNDFYITVKCGGYATPVGKQQKIEIENIVFFLQYHVFYICSGILDIFALTRAFWQYVICCMFHLFPSSASMYLYRPHHHVVLLAGFSLFGLGAEEVVVCKHLVQFFLSGCKTRLSIMELI
jgi:hypothetical protein